MVIYFVRIKTTMKTHELEVGDRVYLISNTYISLTSNPIKGSSYECRGTVHKILTDGATPLNCVVKWDNKTSNYYTIKNDLEVINIKCKEYKSIW